MVETGLICPNCKGALKESYAEANYGRILLLDQCETCGGIWFDQWELYLLREAEARRLDTINENSLLSSNPHPMGEGLCPRCKLKLEPFKDPCFPKDSEIMRCNSCNGLWLNRGELSKYGNHKESILSTQKRAAPTYLPVAEGEERIEAVKRLGSAINLKQAPEEPPKYGLMDTEEGLKEDVAAIIMQILLKLIFRI
ncbi:MAG: zf-TFIIB domain-containing protein [Deltaproteobacteria bacterium]|nr:zf-TFIIB domain-containing protein [Deltaproteobacteria bacterium]